MTMTLLRGGGEPHRADGWKRGDQPGLCFICGVWTKGVWWVFDHTYGEEFMCVRCWLDGRRDAPRWYEADLLASRDAAPVLDLPSTEEYTASEPLEGGGAA
jgi:hypothetical protein